MVYLTATLPYAMLVILLIRGLSLPGASDGVLFYLLPEISRLTDTQVDVSSSIKTAISLHHM